MPGGGRPGGLSRRAADHITQAPVQPGEAFVYELTPKDAGTFWFHPHVRASEQVERGLYGVLVVEDPQPPPYSEDLAWVLDDFLLDEHACACSTRRTAACSCPTSAS